MDIKQLRYFLEVLKAQSFTKAAESLRIAQPAIGVQIRNLEEELGVKLLVRHSRGVMPTEAGAVLRRKAESLVRAFEEARQEVVDTGSEPRGRVRIGLTTTVTHVLAAELARSCRQRLPAVSLVFSEGTSERLAESIALDRLDVALTYYPPRDSGIDYEPLAQEALHFAVRTDHPAAISKDISLREALEDREILLSSQSSYFRTRVENAARANGIELRIVYEVDSVPMMKELVRGGIGCAIAPYGAVRPEVDDGHLVARRIVDPEIKRTFYLTNSRKRLTSRAVDAVCEEIKLAAAAAITSGDARWEPPPVPAEPLSQSEVVPLVRRPGAKS